MLLSPSVGKSEREEEEEKFKKRESEKGNPERGAQLFSELGRGARIPFVGQRKLLSWNQTSNRAPSFPLSSCLVFPSPVFFYASFFFLPYLERDNRCIHNAIGLSSSSFLFLFR